jgi:predicted metal-dependent hydrolase
MTTRPTMTVLPGTPPIPVQWRWSGRARRLSLRVSRLDGRVTLTLPPRVAHATAEAFLNERHDWLRAAVAEAHAPCPVADGTLLPVAGDPLRVTSAATRGVLARATGFWCPTAARRGRGSPPG